MSVVERAVRAVLFLLVAVPVGLVVIWTAAATVRQFSGLAVWVTVALLLGAGRLLLTLPAADRTIEQARKDVQR